MARAQLRFRMHGNHNEWIKVPVENSSIWEAYSTDIQLTDKFGDWSSTYRLISYMLTRMDWSPMFISKTVHEQEVFSMTNAKNTTYSARNKSVITHSKLWLHVYTSINYSRYLMIYITTMSFSVTVKRTVIHTFVYCCDEKNQNNHDNSYNCHQSCHQAKSEP